MNEYTVNIPDGYFMSWFVTTQAALNHQVTLIDGSGNVYFKESKQSRDINPPLAIGYDYVKGNNLKVIVECISDPDIKFKGMPHSQDILNDNGDIVGKEFMLNLDDSAGNVDYNDVSISIVAWKSRG
jgi:hypothetical protein